MALTRRSHKRGARAGGLLATRHGTLSLAAAVALVAGGLVLLFIDGYRSSVAAEGEPARVLVANGLIEKGSTGDLLAQERMFRTTSVRADQVKEGAITDPVALRGKSVTQDVLPGQQLLATDFRPSRDAVGSRLAGHHRAIAVPGDAAHGLTGPLRAGDRVDILAGFNADNGGIARPVIKKIAANALVLKTAAPDGGEEKGAVLRVPANQAAHVAFAADNGKVWLVLRPGVGVRESRTNIVTLQSLLADTKSIDAEGTR